MAGIALLYRFDAFLLDGARRELRRDGVLVPVEPQVFDLLELLVRSRDRVVSRDDLLAAIWGGRIVSEATLSSRINAARTAIGDSGAAQRLIRTLPRKGLRFVGAVVEEEAVPSAPAAEAGPARRRADADGPAIAVLPFANMSGDPMQDYFADGMAEEIITGLSRCSGLLVIARNSSFAYRGRPVDLREIGRELGVGYLLEGSVRRGGDRLRISGRLIDAASGAQLWSDSFEGGLGDAFALQDRIAERVVAAIEPALWIAEVARLGREGPGRPDAYDLLLRAHGLMHAFTAPSLAAALDCLGQALAIEPGYAPAMAAAAYCHAQRHFQGWVAPGDAHRAAGMRLARRAVELAPNDAQVLWMAAFAIWNLAQEGRETARELFARSVMLNPNSAMALTLAGWIETMAGRHEAGRDMLRRAQLLNPRDPQGWFAAGAMAIAAVVEGDYASAIAWAERALVQNRRFAVALRVLVVALVNAGQQERAVRILGELLEVEPGLTVSGFFARIPVPVPSMARIYAEALRRAGLPE